MDYKFGVKGMSCNHCVNTVKDILMSIRNVKSVSVSLSKQEVELTGEVNFEEIQRSFDSTPYQIFKK